jgi:hypothetical protein
MSKAADQPSMNTFSSIVDLLIEHRIKLAALEQVLKETDPLIHELYLGKIEDLRAQKTAEINQVPTQTPEAHPTES